MTVAVYAGSFDPFTYGHLDILKRGLKIFDKVLVAVAYNPEKEGLLTTEERVNIIKKCTENLKGVKVFSFDGLTVDFAKKHNATVLLRGIRSFADYEYENQLSQINSSLNKNIETIFLISESKYSHISSSAVRELLSHKCDLSEFVPKPALEYLHKKFNAAI